MATEHQVYSTYLLQTVSVVLFSCLIINCHLSLAWFQVEKCQSQRNLTRPNGGSKFQVLLHDFPSLRQQWQESCTFYVRSRNKRQFLKVEHYVCARNSYLRNLRNIICETMLNNANHYLRKLRKLLKLSCTAKLESKSLNIVNNTVTTVRLLRVARACQGNHLEMPHLAIVARVPYHRKHRGSTFLPVPHSPHCYVAPRGMCWEA